MLPEMRAALVLEGVREARYVRGRLAKVTVDDMALVLGVVDAPLIEALRRSTAMAHALGDRQHNDPPDDWTKCKAPVCANAQKVLGL